MKTDLPIVGASEAKTLDGDISLGFARILRSKPIILAILLILQFMIRKIHCVVSRALSKKCNSMMSINQNRF
jgi:hypothetical protein